MPTEGPATLARGRKLSLRRLGNIIKRQDRNFRVILFWHIVGGLLGGLSGSYLGMYPYDLGATITEVGYLTSVNALSACVPALVGGALAQKYGKKRIVLYIWPSYVGFFLLMMAAPNWLFLVPAYLVYAIAYAGDPAFVSLYADSLDEETRAEAISIDSTISGMLALLMPPVGGFLVEYFGGIRNPNSLRIFYGLYSVFHATTMVYFWKSLQDDGPHRNDESIRKSLGSLNAILIESRVRRYLVFTIISSLTAGLSAPFVTIYIFSEIGVSPTFVGIMTAASTGITYIILNLGAWWSDRVGRKTPIVMGYIFSASALVTLAFANTADSLLIYYFIAALTAIGSAANSALVYEYVPSDLRSRYFGAREGLTLLCLSIGPPIGGIIYALLGAKFLFLIQAGSQYFLILPYFLIAIPETKKTKVRTPARFLRRPRIPDWLILHPRTHKE